MTETYIPTAISYHQMIAGGGLHSPVVRREAATYSQHLIERTGDQVCIPRTLAAGVVEFLERITGGPWYLDENGFCEDVMDEAARLLSHWSNGGPSSSAEVDAVMFERYGPVPVEEMAPTGLEF